MNIGFTPLGKLPKLNVVAVEQTRQSAASANATPPPNNLPWMDANVHTVSIQIYFVMELCLCILADTANFSTLACLCSSCRPPVQKWAPVPWKLCECTLPTNASNSSSHIDISRAVIRPNRCALKLAGSFSSTTHLFKTEVQSRTIRTNYTTACDAPETTSANRKISVVDVEPSCNFVFHVNDAVFGVTRSNIRIPTNSYSSTETALSKEFHKRTVKSAVIRTAVLQSRFPQTTRADSSSH